MTPRPAHAVCRSFPIAAVATALYAVAALAQPQQFGFREDPKGKDELWEVQTVMEMEGMKMAMPGGATKVCMEKGKQDSGAPVRDDCKVVESRQSGNRVTFRMVCKDAKNDYTVTGDTVWNPNSYEGRMAMAGKMDGHQADMKMSYTGKKVGNCVSTVKQDIAKMEADSARENEKLCRDAIDQLNAPFFEAKGPCAAKRNEFSAAVAKAAKDMQDPVQFAAYSKKAYDLKNTFAKYGQDYPGTQKIACAKAVDSRNWSFVGSGNCDDDARRLGRINCETRGRSPDQAFFPLCSRYAALTKGGGGGGSDGTASAAGGSSGSSSAAAPAAQPKPADSVQQGLDAVRKLLPF